MTENPFLFGRMVAGNTFTDREKETRRLVANFRNGINTVLISPRRWGKSPHLTIRLPFKNCCVACGKNMKQPVIVSIWINFNL